jgi:hypothetical protein
MSASDLCKGYAACKERTKLYMADSPWMRKKFLTDKLMEAIESDRVEEAKIVKDLLRNEAQKKTWGGIHRTMGKSGGGRSDGGTKTSGGWRRYQLRQQVNGGRSLSDGD